MAGGDEGDRPGFGARLRRAFGLDGGKAGTAIEPAQDTPAVAPPPALRDGAAIMDAVVGRVHELVAEARGDPSFARWRRPYVLQYEPVQTRAALKELERAEKAELLRELLRLREAPPERRDEAPDVAAIMPLLLQQMAPLTVEEATLAMRFLALGPKHLWGLQAPTPGLQPLLAGMERGDAGRFAGHAPLREAYAALRERCPTLHPSEVRAREIEARLQRLLDLAADRPQAAQRYTPPAGATPPSGPRLPRLAGDAEAAQVQAFGDAFETLGAELRAWMEAQNANPRWSERERAWHDWRIEAARLIEADRTGRPVPRPVPPRPGAPLDPDDVIALRDRLRRTPLAWLDALDPPPPAWVLDAEAIHADAAAAGRAAGFLPPRFHTLRSRFGVIAEASAESQRPYDGASLATLRDQAAGILGTRARDWAVDGVQEADILQADGGPLFDLLWKARSAAPGKAWLRDAEALRTDTAGAARQAAVMRWLDLVAERDPDAPGRPEYASALWYHHFETRVLEYIRAFGSPRNAAIIALCTNDWFSLYPWHHPPARLSDANDIVLRGCVWFLADDPAAVPRLLRLALTLLERVPTELGVTYRSLIGINACIGALGRIATPEAVAALGRIQRRVRDQGLNKTIAKAMASASAAAGMTIEDLEEISVPAFGLSGGGDPVIEVALAGGATATLGIASSTAVPVTLRSADGRVPKSVPAAVKQDKDSTEALKTLRATAKEIADVLGVQRLRLERSWLTGRSWTGRDFQDRILDHPLLGWLAARLVWTVTPADGGAIRSFALPTLDPTASLAADDTRMPPIGPEDVVALWHPLGGEGAAAVQAWRGFLDRHGIVQPIRQAWRETYPLTDAERATATYSNRFAGHFLRQAQANALARLRGWVCRTRMDADVPNDEPTHLKLPALGLCAEFWTEGAGGEGHDRTEAGALLYLRTDRVLFRPLRDSGDWRRDGGKGLAVGAGRVPVEAVPAIAFSEVMRDVDLMVGVASIGADANWLDRGADAQHPSQWRRDYGDAYWHAFNAAALEGSAAIRREFLATLLPKLAIAPHCTLEERHLLVQGRLRRYRIHLGSGASFVDGPGTYLCIVPDGVNAAAAPDLRLPFEGDATLSLILSKAFLLVRDDLITDPGIIRQIG